MNAGKQIKTLFTSRYPLGKALTTLYLELQIIMYFGFFIPFGKKAGAIRQTAPVNKQTYLEKRTRLRNNKKSKTG